MHVPCEPKWLAQSGIRKMSHDLHVLHLISDTPNAQESFVLSRRVRSQFHQGQSIGGGDFNCGSLIGSLCLRLLSAALKRIGEESVCVTCWVCGRVEFSSAPTAQVCITAPDVDDSRFAGFSSQSCCSIRASRHASFSPIVGAHMATWIG